MSSMDKIAETLAADFTAAVKASTKATRAAIDGITARIEDADAARSEGLAEVRRMQEDAARIAADSLRLAEKIEGAYRDEMRAVLTGLNALRGPALVASHDRPRAIAGGRADA